MKAIQVGDRVRYSARFLRSIGVYTGDLPFAQGVVVQVAPINPKSSPHAFLATVAWDRSEIPQRVLTANLTRFGSVELD